ncbi:LAMI_0C08746g1_1 [Lachancea mirantina]|uniref:LAMI_0C08746g1_1 n=1 Tax=Lachancea mirantina TaxID=1230905 RepID=A0A1G4J5F5_9SACH|nr:LAMI_0C08746g1_1 [Lachancea mirantina]
MNKERRDQLSARNKGSSSGKQDEKSDSGKFLKVSPNLFTAERLPLFDSLDLYTTLIKSSKALEKGERLHNLSWRIVNKALLKHKDVNRSKKRDGVRNLYQVIDPAQNLTPRIRPASQPNRSPSGVTNGKFYPMQVMSAMQSNPTLKDERNIDHQTELQKVKSPRVPAMSAANIDRSRSVINTVKRNDTKGVGMPPKHRPPNLTVRSTKSTDQVTPQNVTTGFRPNEAVIKKPDETMFIVGGTPSPELRSQTDKKKAKKPISKLVDDKSEPKTGTHPTTTGQSSAGVRTQSLFTPKNPHEGKNGRTSEHIFFSSDEEESELDSLSDDSDFYDDDEEEKYYQTQLDKLLFDKNERPNGSGASSPLAEKHHDSKRSLLSGLFLNEMQKRATPSTVVSPITTQRPTLRESSITAVGDVTPSESHKNPSIFGQDLQQDHPNKPTKSSSASLFSARRSLRGSFSSLLSDGTRERYTHESNAPLTAQTILPTALSTHMFVPNNVHQQRLARSGSEKLKGNLRRESMDIPSKNRNNSFLKTRMEISEEESFTRNLPRRNLH